MLALSSVLETEHLCCMSLSSVMAGNASLIVMWSLSISKLLCSAKNHETNMGRLLSSQRKGNRLTVGPWPVVSCAICVSSKIGDVTNKAESEDDSQMFFMSPSLTASMNFSALLAGLLLAGRNNCLRTLLGSISQASMCFTTLPVSCIDAQVQRSILHDNSVTCNPQRQNWCWKVAWCWQCQHLQSYAR